MATLQLTADHLTHIGRFVPAFRRFLDDYEQAESVLARRARNTLYENLLTPEALHSMTELELGQIVSSLWANHQWGNKSYLVDKLIAANSLPAIAKHLRDLLWGAEEVGRRYDTFRRAIKGLGAASITELLAFAHPQTCGVWNDAARGALEILGLRDVLPALRKAQISGHEYRRFNALLALLQAALESFGIEGLDYLDLNSFLYMVWELGREQVRPMQPPSAEDDTDDFDHDAVVDQLVNIGQWLGFVAEKEKIVARGAKVDAIWQARIANLGVVTYVFEVQRRGSVDSLILNLQRAQNNPTVQRLIVVARAESLERIRGEIATLPESFRKSVGFMEVSEAVRAAELIGELSGIIGRLELVRSVFDVT
ncbi:MAG: hypothetical protein DYG88_10350 [Chloroflexi bacterium CFX4]|nr:hypothetical protein [Chloroflexi bacterium CFX4]MDL1923279.1 hypothetical protein [Chloroflexi bacterium CFX3]